MTRTCAPFLSSMLFAILAPLFIVLTTAFVAIPYSLGGHPGEVRLAQASASTYHPS